MLEGALFAGMVGLGEFWFVTDLVRLGGSSLEIAAQVTVPQLLGAVGALGMLRALRQAQWRRPWVVGAVIGQASILLILSAAAFTGWSSPLGLVVAACLYSGFGQAAGTGWASWMGELVPAPVRGRWFGSRTRWISATTFVGILVGGAVLQLTEPTAADANAAGGLGYAIVYAVAGAFRLGCAALLSTSWEPPFSPPEAVDHCVGVLQGPTGRQARGVVAVSAAMLVAVCVSTPFFAPHMLETLRFSYVTYLASQGIMVATKVAALGPFGRLVDRVGPVPAYQLSAVLVALIPVPWVFADRAWIVFFAQAWSGVAWAGHEVALLALTLAAVGPRQRAVLLASQSVANGVAQVGGGLVGTGLAGIRPPGHELTFAVSAVGRLAVAVVSPVLLAPLVRAGPTQWWDLGARVVAWLPNGGLVRQLVAAEEPASLDPPIDGARVRHEACPRSEAAGRPPP